jgi:hypothetical protein
MIIGIDPGAKGGVGFITNSGELVEAWRMPDKKLLYGDLKTYMATFENETFYCCIEKSFPSHNQGITSIFNHGYNYGSYITTLSILGIEIVEVLPRVWKNGFGLSKDKQESMKLCLRLWPESKRLIYGSKGGMLDGVAEALLIAEYGRQRLKRRLRGGI